ncbi:BREX-1 system adenine-specific DNA-methyltransferase PglX [Clostridium sp. 2218st1_F5_2218SCRN_220325]|uniref:BREX-1 system adenine-specific DNA-methyltransferase PglX n=1 Tax=Clostridium sp. 2218st1_F5_2218SCRN_220325 TaxID=3143056 RepID=UPI00319E3365
MDKNAIKNYAVWARNELIERVTQKALEYGITENEIVDADVDSIDGKLLNDIEKGQRQDLIKQIEIKGFYQVIEEVAYTWFNRFCALRFMEVNGYLPTHVRVFTDDENNFKPQILTEAIHLDIEGLNIDKIYKYKENNEIDELYKYLLIKQCNALNAILPGMFQKINDYTELLFPDYLLRQESIIDRMIKNIKEDDWKEQVQIIGWLYQYYNIEVKEKIDNRPKSNKIEKEDIPAETQLFTPDWIVKYIIDNSLGRYWVERNSESDLKNDLEYFIEPRDGFINIIDENIIPNKLTLFDPCMGSAHFLVYAFDVFIKIYSEYGYTNNEAVKFIIENNLYGLDIDERASQLAYFAIMMKARQYDSRFFKHRIQPNLYSIKESDNLDIHCLKYFINDKEELKFEINKLICSFKDAKEYGSIIKIPEINFKIIYARFDEIIKENSIYTEIILEELLPIVKVGEMLSKKYTIVVTNPPYLNNYNYKLKKYIVNNYKDYGLDLFSVFIYRNFDYCKLGGYCGFMSPNTWMFTKSYENLRRFILNKKSIITLIQMAKGAFFKEATVDICSFVLKNEYLENNGLYIRLEDFKGDMDVQNKKVLEAIQNKDCGYFFETSKDNYFKIPLCPIAYWISEVLLKNFSIGEMLKNKGDTRQGMATSDNNRFLRMWHEVDFEKIGIGCASSQEAILSCKKWYPYNKGGEFRKWYGNINYVINYENDGFEVKEYAKSLYKTPTRTIKSISEYFKQCLSWSKISSGDISFRYYPKGFIFDVAGCCIFFEDKKIMFYDFGFINSKVAKSILSVISPTLNYEAGHIASLPIIIEETKLDVVGDIARENILISEIDWDSFEISWNFKKHPLINGLSIKEANQLWSSMCLERFYKLKSNEEELNRIFIDIYGLQDELTPEVKDEDITIRKADLTRDIKSFISYAVGCMFGRYSLDVDGLAYAGREWDESKYKTFKPDKNNIIPICDDEYFEDDIVGRFVEFVEVVYGSDTLEENLKFISDTLGGRGTPREIIRKYFLNDFFKDHCSTYSVTGSGKRPIYWLFDSGRKNGFKALMYVHRYQPDTIARLRTDYVHEQQARYRSAIESIEKNIESASRSEKVKLTKKLNKLKEQEIEIREYEEKVHHLADQMISIDLDDGVKHNYEIFKEILAKIK